MACRASFPRIDIKDFGCFNCSVLGSMHVVDEPRKGIVRIAEGAEVDGLDEVEIGGWCYFGEEERHCERVCLVKRCVRSRTCETGWSHFNLGAIQKCRSHEKSCANDRIRPLRWRRHAFNIICSMDDWLTQTLFCRYYHLHTNKNVKRRNCRTRVKA